MISLNNRLYILIFLSGLQSAVLNVNLPFGLKTHSDFDADTLSLFALSLYASGFAFILIIPFITDIFTGTRKFFVYLTLIAQAIGLLCLSLTDDFFSAILFAVFLLGPGSCISALLFSILRGQNVGARDTIWSRGFFSLSWIVGPGLGAGILDYGNLAALCASVIALIPLMMWLLLPVNEVASKPSSAPRVSPSSGGKYTALASMFFAFVLFQASNVLSLLATPLIVASDKQHPLALAGAIFSLCAAAELFFIYILSRVHTPRSEKTLLIIGCASGITYYVILALFENIAVLFVAQFLNAFCIAILMAVGLVVFQNMQPKRTGLLTGLFVNTNRIGGIIAAPLLAFSVKQGGNYQFSGWVCAFMLLGSGILISVSNLRNQDV